MALVKADLEQPIESLVTGRRLETLARGEDCHVRYPLPSFTRPVPSHCVRCRRWKVETGHRCRVLSREVNQRRPDGGVRIGVVHHDGPAAGQRVRDECFLPPLRPAIVAEQVLADMIVGAANRS
jgi:hypothetical protein